MVCGELNIFVLGNEDIELEEEETLAEAGRCWNCNEIWLFDHVDFVDIEDAHVIQGQKGFQI